LSFCFIPSETEIQTLAKTITNIICVNNIYNTFLGVAACGFDLNIWKASDGNVVDTNFARALTDTNWFISDTMYVAGWSDGNYVIDVNVYDY